MNTSTTITKITPALLKAQKEIGAAKKETVNPFFKSKYADLGSVMEACKEQLNANGITVLQPVGHDEHGDYVETVLLHESGEFVSEKMRLIPTTEVQKQGSAITYARRYGLQSLVFIPSEDDDGNSATTSSKPTTVSQNTNKTEVTQEMLQEEARRHGQCKDCGADMMISSKGNVVCSEACWAKGQK